MLTAKLHFRLIGQIHAVLIQYTTWIPRTLKTVRLLFILLFAPVKKMFDTELLILGVPLHPEYELEDKDYVGVKRAAKRKLWHELGIKGAALPSLENFHYITRLHYKSLAGSEDGIWGEHEST